MLLSYFLFSCCFLFLSVISSDVSELTVCAGHGNTDARATDPNAIRNVERYRLLITLFLVTAFMCMFGRSW